MVLRPGGSREAQLERESEDTMTTAYSATHGEHWIPIWKLSALRVLFPQLAPYLQDEEQCGVGGAGTGGAHVVTVLRRARGQGHQGRAAQALQLSDSLLLLVRDLQRSGSSDVEIREMVKQAVHHGQ